MEERTLRILEFDKVKEQISAHVACSLGKAVLAELAPFGDIDTATYELTAVDEAVQVLYRFGPLPYGGITDIRAMLKKAAIGGTLGSSDLVSVADFIAGGRQVRQSVDHVQTLAPLPVLQETVDPMFDARRTEQEIRQAIDVDGSVFDHASPGLRKIRQDKRSAETKVRQTLEQVLRTQQKYLQETVIAMRGNYYCLAVRADNKNQIRGVVRDYSSSGNTVFIEPQAVIEATEWIRELSFEEEREIERILHQLSGVVAGVSDELNLNAEILARIDAWFAKAHYAKIEHCERPNLTQDGVWRLRKARHPLISYEAAVPIDVTLGETFGMLVVTGPNTGGKTVTLKTIGLLTIMAMSGCFIPTGSASDVGWCGDIFADIGDEQSIEQSLSTFSSHMRTIVSLLGKVQYDSLVLLDELGAGTDPGEGAAVAIAILDFLNARGCKVVATTHYAELKGYAFTEPRAVNASVEFDVETLAPTYRLLVGVPGRSNALAIAKRLGLDERIINQAKTFVQAADVRVEELIAQMERARRDAEQAHHEAEVNRKAAQVARDKWETLQTQVEAETDKIRAQAHSEAQAVVEKATFEANRIIDELRRLQRNGSVKDHQLVDLRKSLESALPTLDSPVKKRSKKQRVNVGAHVRVLSLNQKGEVIEKSADGDSVMVQLGLLKMKVATSDLEVLSQGAQVQPMTAVKKSLTKDIRMELDVRGELVDDALLRIDKYLDDAVLSGLQRIVIIHGKGTGALRDAVRRHLGHHRQVVTRVPGGAGEGGDGVTVVQVRV